MLFSDVLDLLRKFANRTREVRGYETIEGLMFLSLSDDGGGQLQAPLRPMHSADNPMLALAKVVLNDDVSEATCDFLNTDQMIALLKGEREPVWVLSDEKTPPVED